MLVDRQLVVLVLEGLAGRAAHVEHRGPEQREVPGGAALQLGVLGVAAQRSAGVLDAQTVARTRGRREDLVAGVADQGHVRGAGQVDVLRLEDHGRGVRTDVGQFGVGDGVAVVDAPLLDQRVTEAQGRAGGVAGVVVKLPFPVIQVDAARHLRVEETRVGEVEVVAGRLAARVSPQAQPVTGAEQVVLADLAHEQQVLGRGVAGADAELAGGLLLDIHHHVHLVFVEGGLGGDGDLLEVAEPVELLGGGADRLGIETAALLHLQVTADDVVAGPVVAGDLHPVEMDKRPLLDLEADVHALAGIRLAHLGVHLGKGVALLGVEVGEPGQVLAQHLAVEELLLADLQAGDQFLAGLDQVTLNIHRAHPVARPLLHGKGHEQGVVLLLDDRLADPGVHIALVVVEGGHPFGVLLEHVHLEHTCVGQPGNPPGVGAGLDHILEFVRGETLVPLEADLFDGDLLAFLDLETDLGVALLGLADLGIDRGIVIALGLVEFAHLGHRVVDLGGVEDGIGGDAGGVADILFLDLLGAGDHHAADERLLRDPEDHVLAGLGVRGLDLDVIKIAHAENVLQVLAESGRIVQVARLGRDLLQDGAGVDALVAGRGDGGHGGALVGKGEHGADDLAGHPVQPLQGLGLAEGRVRYRGREHVVDGAVDAYLLAHLVEAADHHVVSAGGVGNAVDGRGRRRPGTVVGDQPLGLGAGHQGQPLGGHLTGKRRIGGGHKAGTVRGVDLERQEGGVLLHGQGPAGNTDKQAEEERAERGRNGLGHTPGM